METLILINWIIGAVILIYFSLLDLWTKDYKMALATILFAAFPFTAIILTIICYAGLIRYFLVMQPRSFKRLILDIQDEFMIQTWRAK
jgi:formate/nitrite transporter FocA (FNT family)